MNSKQTILALQTWLTWSLMLVTLSAQEARLEAWKRHLEMASSSPFKDLQWLTMGPKFAGEAAQKMSEIQTIDF